MIFTFMKAKLMYLTKLIIIMVIIHGFVPKICNFICEKTFVFIM